jgi:hypothetical protein
MKDDLDLGFVEPYDCNDERIEPRPDSVIFQPVFSKLRDHIEECIRLLRDPLRDSKYSDAITKGLLQEVQSRTKQGQRDSIYFAVAGEQSAGTPVTRCSLCTLADGVNQARAPSSIPSWA